MQSIRIRRGLPVKSLAVIATETVAVCHSRSRILTTDRIYFDPLRDRGDGDVTALRAHGEIDRHLMPDLSVRAGTSRQLLVSIHDVAPPFEREVDQLADQLARILGGPRFAMLVVPDHWARAPLANDRAFARRLRDWAEAGVEMFLHGWFHRDDCQHRGLIAGLKARHMTEGEGEFLGLSADQAERRMRAGRDVIEQATGRAVAGFIAPAWLYGPGAHRAMRRCGFKLAENHWRIWNPTSGDVLSRSPVITWASRTPARTASSLAVAGLARFAGDLMPTMRVAVHPGDVSKPALVRSISDTVGRLARSRHNVRYADLLSAGGYA